MNRQRANKAASTAIWLGVVLTFGPWILVATAVVIAAVIGGWK